MTDQRHDPFDDVPRDEPAPGPRPAGDGDQESGVFEEPEPYPEYDDYDDAPAPPRRRYGGLASCLVLLVVLGAIGAVGFAGVSAGIDKVREMLGGPEDYTGEGRGTLLFEVEAGDSSTDIARRLKRAGVVKSVEAFTDAADADSSSLGIQFGFYELRRRMPAEAALEVLVEPDNLVQSSVTIPEGLRVEDTVELLSEKTEIPVRSFERVLDDPSRIGLPRYAGGNAEGYLFPATYAFSPNATAGTVLAEMVARWRQAAEQAGLVGGARELGYTPGEVMIVASLVEAEANRDEDRGKVARVIYNRLETDATNGLLQIDATVNYALGRDLGLGLTSEDLRVDSPYNTRLYPGLPPGPIESPGDAAIEAAVRPTEGDWIYYVTVNLDTGETKFTESYQEFLRYKRELTAWCGSSDRC